MKQIDACVLNVGYAEDGTTDGPAVAAAPGRRVYATVGKDNGEALVYVGAFGPGRGRESRRAHHPFARNRR